MSAIATDCNIAITSVANGVANTSCLAEPAAGPSVHARPAMVALCVVGLEREVSHRLVVDSARKHVVHPLRRRGGAVDAFLVVEPKRRSRAGAANVTARVRAFWRPKRLLVLWDAAPVPASRCGHLNAGSAYEHDAPRAFFLAFHKVRAAYALVRVQEREQGWNYDWLIRSRTDIVFLSEVPPLAWLRRDRVYVPSAGLGCCPYWNDHLFLCPRPLCANYFKLFELYEGCTDGPPTTTVGGKFVPDSWEDEPLRPFPLTLYMQAFGGKQSWFFARYGGALCASYTPRSCIYSPMWVPGGWGLRSSGAMRAITWGYALKRRRLLECERMARTAFDEASAAGRPWFKAHRACLELRAAHGLQP
jgi:hypothetical protein